MAEFYRRFEAAEWTVDAGTVTFNADGSVRMQYSGANVAMRWTRDDSNGAVALPAGSDTMILGLHGYSGLVSSISRVRVYCRNFNDSGWALLAYPTAEGAYFAHATQTIVQSGGGIRIELRTDGASSDITIDRWSLFGDGEISGAGPATGSAVYNPFTASTPFRRF